MKGKLIATTEAETQFMKTATDVAFPLELDENNSAVISHGIELLKKLINKMILNNYFKSNSLRALLCR